MADALTDDDLDEIANKYFAKQAADNEARKIDISGLDKAVLLEELWKNSGTAGVLRGLPLKLDKALIHKCLNPEPIEYDDGRPPRKADVFVDYLCGRVIKCDFTTDRVDPYLYDRDNGSGAFLRVVNALRRA